MTPGAAGAPGGRGAGAGGAPPTRHNMPSHGFYVRHVKGIQFDTIELRTAKDDLRPAFVLDDVQDADVFRVKVPQVAGTPVIALHNVTDFAVHMCSGVPDTQLKTADNKTL